MRSSVLSVTVLLLGLLLCSTQEAFCYQTATSFQFPLPNWNVNGNGFWSCQVSCYHLGEDVAASATTPVYAIANGLVKEAQSHNGYGGTVISEHYTGSEHVVSVTGHMKTSTLAVSAGQEVTKGQLIGYVGTSAENGGWSEHCHLGIHKGQYQTGTTCDNDHWVYAGYDGSGCTHDNWYTPSDFVNSHQATYSTSFVSQTPSGQFNMTQGESRTFTVQFKNEGNTTWYNDAQSYPNDYVELKSCSNTGAVTNSFLNYPYDGSLGWLNSQSACTMTQSSVAHNGTATFTFTGKAASDASLGLHDVYFRPNHSTGGLMQDWGGMHFQVNVVAPVASVYIPFTGLFNADNVTDIGLYDPANGDWFVATSTGSAFTPSSFGWLGNWGASTTAFIPLIADFNRDGETDICLYEKALGRWYVALNQGNSTFAQSGTYWLDNWGASATAFTPLIGDFNGDGYTDICLYEKALGRWYVALNQGNSTFAQSGTYWLDNWGASATAFTPLASDFNGDGKTDVCLYEKALGRWYVSLNQGNNTFAAGGYWLDNWGASATAFIPIASWFTSDAHADVMLYEKALGRWYVGPNQGNNIFAAGGYWLDNWGASADGFDPLIGDFNGDGKADICAYEKALGRWYVALNQGNNTFAGGTYWLSSWGVQSGSPKVVAPSGETQLPTTFALFQNYPNPFNPTTTISYSLPEATHVSLMIYNILGQEVARLVDTYQPVGSYSISWDALAHPSGIYLYRLHTDQATETRKMLILK